MKTQHTNKIQWCRKLGNLWLAFYGKPGQKGRFGYGTTRRKAIAKAKP